MPRAARTQGSQSLLLVDRSRVIHEIVSRFLGDRGFSVWAVSDAAAARAALASRSPAYLMVEADAQGDALLREVEELPEPRPYVIVTTRHPSLEEEARISMAGAVAYLGKPLEMEALERAIRGWPLVFDDGSEPRCASRRPQAHALWCEPDGDDVSMVSCPVRDLSCDGALLESRGVLACGMRLRLLLCFAFAEYTLDATVVRLDGPSCAGPAGVRVAFDDPPEAFLRSVVSDSGA